MEVLRVAVEDQVDDLCKWLSDARAKTFPAFRNLREIQPGFSSTTPGNGDPGGGSGGHGPSIVERLVDDDGNMRPDDAATDLASATLLLRRMKTDIRDYRDIMQRWGYSTAGEHHVGERVQPGRPTEGSANREQYCSHHEKYNIAEPIGAKGRGGLCGWCYSWQAAEGELPPGNLIDARSRGMRITTAMVDSWRKSRALAEAGHKKKAKKRSRKKR